MLPLVAAAVGVGALAWRTLHLRAVRREANQSRRLGPDGIALGGEGFELTRTGAPALLLLHGGGDTPQTLRYLADALHMRGFAVSAPLLPGHGRTLRDFNRVTADDLTQAARAEFNRLRARHQWVGVIGVSMGGALAVQLAAADGPPAALGLVAPYLSMPQRIARAARWSWLWGPIVPIVRSSEGKSILDPLEQKRNLAYGVFTAGGLRALFLTVARAVAALPGVTAPTIMIQSRKDNRVTVEDGERAFARLGASDKRLVWIDGAAHIITVDYGRDHVFVSLSDWMETHGAATKA
jgi:carboxylesterase